MKEQQIIGRNMCSPNNICLNIPNGPTVLSGYCLSESKPVVSEKSKLKKQKSLLYKRRPVDLEMEKFTYSNMISTEDLRPELLKANTEIKVKTQSTYGYF